VEVQFYAFLTSALDVSPGRLTKPNKGTVALEFMSCTISTFFFIVTRCQSDDDSGSSIWKGPFRLRGIHEYQYLHI
jgi:hypothetical protein